MEGGSSDGELEDLVRKNISLMSERKSQEAAKSSVSKTSPYVSKFKAKRKSLAKLLPQLSSAAQDAAYYSAKKSFMSSESLLISLPVKPFKTTV